MLVLLQPTGEKSRTYSDYESLVAAVEGLCSIFEETYKKENKVESVEYEIDDVIGFFENFDEVLFFTFHEGLRHYLPRDFEWIRGRLEEFAEDPSKVTAPLSVPTPVVNNEN